MSDHGIKSCGKASDLNVVLNNADMMQSQDTYRTQWMAHWTRARHSSTSESHIHCAVSNERNTDYRIGKGCLLSENMSTLNPGVVDLTLDGLQPEAAGSEKRFKATKEIDDSIDSKAKQTDTFSFHKMPDSVSRSNFAALRLVDSDNFDSEQQHFPMFEINRKIGTILAPKRKYGHGPLGTQKACSYLPLCESKSTSHVIEFATEEHQFHTWGTKQIADKWIGSSKSIKDISPHRDDYIKLGSPATVDRVKFQHPYTRTQMCTETDCQNTCLRHEQCTYSSHSTFMASGLKNHNQIRNSENLLPGFMDGSVQLLANCYPSDGSLPSIPKVCGKEVEDAFYSGPWPTCNSTMRLGKLDDFEHAQYFPHKMSKCSFHDPEMLEKGGAVSSLDDKKEESQMFLDTAQYFLLTSKMGMHLADRYKKTEGISSEVKEKVFEMFMLPTILQCRGNGERSSGTLVNSIATNNAGTDAHFMEKQESSAKTDTMYIDTSQSSKSPEGATSLKAQEGVEAFPKLAKAEMAATSTAGQTINRNSGSKLNISIKHPVLLEREGFVHHRELSTSRTESLESDHFASNFKKPDNSNPSRSMEHSLGPEVSRWVKRLRHCTPHYSEIGTKRLKLGDALISEGTLPFLSKVINHKESTSDMSTCLRDHQKSDKDLLVPKDGGVSSWDAKKTVNSWISRWCHKSRQTGPQAQLADPVQCMPENFNNEPGILEAKQFPSIAAMAMMGKAVRNISPRVYHRRGSSVVWDTEGL